MLKIHEFFSATGELSVVSLRVRDEQLEIVVEGEAWPLPVAALGAVFARYGAPFDTTARVAPGASFALHDGQVLRHVRHLAGYDVIARDYLVYERPDGEALCALGASVAAALLHLGRVNDANVG